MQSPMHLRTRHLACLILLLSALSGAEGASLRHGDILSGHYSTALLAHEHAATSTEAALDRRPPNIADLALPVTRIAQHRTPWTMRPPSAHSLQLQAATAFAI